MVIAGMKNRRRYGIQSFSVSRFAWLLAKNSGRQNAAQAPTSTNSVMKT